MRAQKRANKPYQSSSPFAKRSRLSLPTNPDYPSNVNVDAPEEKEAPSKQSWLVIVSGVVPGCTVLELKSRFEMFGPIARLHIDRPLGFGYITYRSRDSAQAAITASLDPSSPITVGSNLLQVSWANDPVPQWKAIVKISSSNDHRPSSKLLRAEIPLGRHGRGKKKLGMDMTATTQSTKPDLPFKGREIIAYDDLL